MGGSCTRLMHAHAREQAPTFTAVNLSPFILYEAIRCFTRNGVRFESLSMCRSRALSPPDLSSFPWLPLLFSRSNALAISDILAGKGAIRSNKGTRG